MLKSLATFSVLALSACAGVNNFEEELTGAEAIAWANCKAEYGEPIGTPPAIAEVNSDYILFAWTKEDLEELGGLRICKTSADGNELIEVLVQGPPF
ncbi:MAG: hypothetical protein AAGH57_10670 [Pseudomonadota bacterium]